MKSLPVLIFCSLLFIYGNKAMCQENIKIKKLPVVLGEVLNDTDGKPVNAHGAGILEYDGTYYMFGEIKKGKTWLVPNQSWEDYRVPAGGISCYSSKDLFKWKYEGVALSPVTGDQAHDLDTSKVIERPKVIYNKTTKQFVMWMHIDANDYSYSHAGVAVSDRPAGPYKYLGSVKPNGQMARDMTLYKDDDEKAYFIYASESNKTMHVRLLADDYLSPTKIYSRITSAENREAPAIFKFNNYYYLITSGCTGWSPNPATYAVANSLLGEWKQYGNPCKGPDAETTFQSQSTYILPMPGQVNTFLFMADRWNKTNLEDSRYVWLPFKMESNEAVIKWVKNEFDIDTMKKAGLIFLLNILFQQQAFLQSATNSKLHFTSKEVTHVFINTPYHYQFNATDSLHSLIKYNIVNLPPWLHYNSSEHSLTGKPVKAGQYKIHLIASTIDSGLHQVYMLTVYDSNTTTILALGNSITNGTNKFNSYRRSLWQLLHNGNYNFDFIGSWSKHHMGGEVPDPDFDMDHDGHSGWTTHDVLSPPDWDKQRRNINDWIKTYTPNIVLIELGTNDVFQCVAVKDAMNNLDSIIDILRNKNSQVKIFLAQIPPLGAQWSDKKLCGTDTSYKRSIEIFNDKIIQLAKLKNTDISNVTTVDLYTNVNPATDMYDDIHPNEGGEKKMAERWFKAINKYLKKLETDIKNN